MASPQAKESQPTKPTQPGDSETAAQVVLDYCAAVRGILNGEQGGPLHPPGLRMASALAEVRASLGRVLALNKPGRAHVLLGRLDSISNPGGLIGGPAAVLGAGGAPGREDYQGATDSL